MKSAPHLLPEDRPEFERAVDEALRDADRRPALAAMGERISAGQLRVMALSAATAIAGEAADEYERYVALRTRLRERLVEDSGDYRGSRDGEQHGGTGELSLAGVGEGVGEASGAGLLAMASVLVPLLAGTAAVIFLLLGYVLRIVTPEPAIAAPMRSAGWVFAVLAAAGIVVAMAELWLTAVRNGSRRGAVVGGQGEHPGTMGELRLSDEVSAARAAWRDALLERGIVPFLADALAAQPGARPAEESTDGAAPGDSRSADAAETDEAGAAPGGTSTSGGSPSATAPVREAHRTEERTPRLGYSHPDFSSRTPSDGTEHGSVRPRYSSPDYSSPDYGGPEHKPE